MKKNFKKSYYNILVPVEEEKEFLLFNALHGGMMVLSEEEGNRLKKLENLEYFERDSDEMINTLIEKDYIVKSDKDEINLYREQCKKRTESVFYKNESPAIVCTIATTNSCNMKCPYCFEFTKPNNKLNYENLDNLSKFLDSIENNSPAKKFSGLGITWYGGEPLLALDVIKKGTEILRGWAKKRGIEYKAEMITNGVLLTKDTWKLLEEMDVSWMQVTLDGTKETHNVNRPLKNPKALNYERILENLANKPDNIKVTIRVNTDKNVFNNFSKFLEELDRNKIWPHKYRSINVQPNICRTYEENNESDISHRIPYEEWNSYYQIMRKTKFEYFNKWAKKNNIDEAKYIYSRFVPSYEECWSVVSPYIFVIDADGYTHKCWELIHDENTRIQHVSEKYDISKYSKQLNYTKFDIEEKCNECNFLPVCGILSCTQHHNEVKNCPYDKERIKEELKKEYLLLTRNPDKVVLSREKEGFVRP